MTNNPGSRELKQLKRDFAELRGDMGDLGNALTHAGADRGRTLYQHTAQQGLRLRRRGEAALGSAHHTIRSRPVSTALIAIGIGCIVGLAVAACRKTRHGGE